jgi:hypothetical protein
MYQEENDCLRSLHVASTPHVGRPPRTFKLSCDIVKSVVLDNQGLTPARKICAFEQKCSRIQPELCKSTQLDLL